ncbi:hypothetical protein Q6D67_07890 [Haliea sp. E1-2-M8]|uniref:hypothetical protein n=1 Tax=Haliea sp. E1-2-M8 TaxID=3064706 RepID=UPI002725310D|nr:hypothetical protein [Haliea sp. E1-2-M8]MDO8861620.1 hypothetical protein [Haliea sp. E1-2-M8]
MAQEYLIGVMMTPVENPDEAFQAAIHEAVTLVDQRLAQRVPNLRLEVFEFVGPHLTPAHGGYSPLELLQLGVIEKVERKPNFLLVVTEVDISSQLTTYIVALPSRLTNVGLISTKRFSPRFWGEPDDTAGLTAQRLAANRGSIWRTVRRSNPFRHENQHLYRGNGGAGWVFGRPGGQPHGDAADPVCGSRSLGC